MVRKGGEVDEFLRLLTLQDANTRLVLLGSALLGLACGVVGSLAVLRHRALIGDTLAHAALPGICVAFFVVGDRHLPSLMLGALVFGLLGVLAVNATQRFTRIKEDAALALVLGTFFGLGIVLSRIIQNQPSGNRAGLDGFLFGKAASMVQSDVILIAAVAAGVLLAVFALLKEFRLLAFDREFASAQGWPVARLDLVMMGLVTVCVVAGLPAVGVVLVAALLIIPGTAARLWTDRLAVMLVLSGGFGATAGIVGTALSAVLPPPPGALSRGWPTGPMIVLVSAAIFLISLLGAPRRGIIARWLQSRGLSASLAARRTGLSPTSPPPEGNA